ncbi:hypothetical protein [Sphingomonas sp.]|uniref:hypothetical protein n=1 Tax=Sphingomonas sp. TaxID=28214 RepID=UPI002EDBA684
MSHDQKPARARLVALNAAPRRRRGDAVPIVLDNRQPKKRGARLMLALLFLLGAAAGGAGYAMVLA